MSYVRLLYGSAARQDNDPFSDLDVLTISSADQDCDYTWEEIRIMQSYGSMFLHHLKLEAREIASDRLGRAEWKMLIHSLPSYQRTLEDLKSFQLVAGDVQSALAKGDSTVAYEASVMARLVRHLAILGCYVAKSPDFTRYGAVERAADFYQVPLPASADFATLYEALLRPSSFSTSAAEVSEWIDFALSMIRAISSIDLEAEMEETQ